MSKLIIAVLVLFNLFAAEDRSPLHNYVSGDAFRAISDFYYEEEFSEFWNKPSTSRYMLAQEIEILDNIEAGDIIFMQTHLVPYFAKSIHPKIEVPYFLITHKSDCTVDEKFLDLMNEPKLLKWFAQNPNIEHEKVVPIPIGIPIKIWFTKRCKDQDVIEKIRELDVKRSSLAYLNINTRTCEKERKWVSNFFHKKNFINRRGKRRYPTYLKDLKTSRYCLSPSGNGIDCWRTWEALMMGCIPIIRPYEKYSERQVVGDHFLFEDLPVIRVESWEEVTEEFLDRKYEEMQLKKWNLEKLYFPFWRDLIFKEVDAFRESYCQTSFPEEFLTSQDTE